jgi:ribosomal protein S6--L-glutamate ligase
MDGVLVRMMPPGSLEQVVFRMDALHRIAAAGIPVLNPPRAVEAAVDKYLTLSLLDRAGIPLPPTWAGERATEALEVFAALGGDVVVKPLFGSEGRGLVRISDPELAWRTFHDSNA